MSRFLRLCGLLAIAVLATGASVSTAEPLDDPSPEIAGLASDATAWPCATPGCGDCEGEACDDVDVDWAIGKIRKQCGNSGGMVSVCCDGPAVEMCDDITCFE